MFLWIQASCLPKEVLPLTSVNMLPEMVALLVWSVGIWQGFQDIASSLYETIVEFGGPALLLIALVDSSFLSIPEGNDILIITLSTGQSWNVMAYYVGMTVFGSVLGCTFLYSIGRKGGKFVEKRLSVEKRTEMKGLYNRWGIWTVLVPALMPPPTPFKIFVLSAGLFRFPLGRFILMVSLGRSIRYFTWGILAVVYGEAARKVLEQNGPTVGVLLLVFLVVALAGVVLVRRRRRKSTSQRR